MSSIAQASRPFSPNRRRRVRQKVHAPAYATFTGASKSEMLDLYEVLDISEIGVSVQCPSPMEVNKQVELCLDLAEARGQISTNARVVWSDSSGRVGLGFPPLHDPALQHLREWLFLNAMAAAGNAASASASSPITLRSVPNPSYTDTLSAASAVQREAESLGADLEAVLSLVASRSQSLLRASGAAIALAGKDAGTMICRASAGESAPPVGATLQVGSGFSGECVLKGRVLRCDDTETDQRVDRQSCRALGIRSILAAPVRSGERVIGLFEVFSPQPHVFGEKDSAVLQRFAETILAAVNRAAADDPQIPPPASGSPSFSSPGSVLFARMPEETTEKDRAANNNAANNNNEDKVGGIRLPRAHLYVLIGAAITISLVLGIILAPSIQERLQAREQNGEHTVLASSQPPPIAPSQSDSSVDAASVEQLREMAKRGNPAAENAIGLLYAQGDSKQTIPQDEKQAAGWFTLAAEDGSVPAQYKLSLLYWGGHGVPKDVNKAYFWAVLSRAGGQAGSKDLAKVLANGMTRAQAAAIEQQAEMWYQQRESRGKPNPGH
jgi:putative methionine-R-sulfoxide reductase with GAF domain